MPASNCSVPGCTFSWKKRKTEKKSLFSVLRPDLARSQEDRQHRQTLTNFMLSVRGANDANVQSLLKREMAAICDSHFVSDDIIVKGKRKELRIGAMPYLNISKKSPVISSRKPTAQRPAKKSNLRKATLRESKRLRKGPQSVASTRKQRSAKSETKLSPIHQLIKAAEKLVPEMKGMCAASNKTPDGFKEVVEGSAKILYENVNNVFYNNVQEFNRDITIAVITEFVKEHIRKKGYEAVEYRKDNKTVATAGSSEDSEGDSAAVNKIFPGEKCEDGITILEALSATGLRSIRLAKEVPGVKKIVANDLSASAVAAIRRNVDYNEVGHVVEPNEDDACILMYNHKVGRKEAFDVVDVDPYGSAVPFLDAAVQAVKPQGLLCVTCTDMAVLTGVTPETCFAKYRSMPLKTKACHEQALRILLSTIELNANKYGRYIEPLISISIDFYVRVFVRVHYGQAKVKYSASKLAHVVRCGGCTSFYLYPVGEYVKTEKGGVKHSAGTAPSVGSKCNLCGCKHHMGGPIWAEPMHNPEFLQNVLQSITSFPERFKTSARMKGILTMISEELHDVPLYYITDELTSVIKCNAPQEVTLRSAILNAGYRVSSFHGLKSSIKTDAPSNVIWDILKAWFHNQNENLRRVKDGSPAMALLKRESTTENVDFTKRKDAEPDSKRKGVVRFPTMPSNWGPKARARDNSDDEIEMTDCLVKKSKRLQGKRKMQNLSNNKSNKKGKNK